MPTFHFYPIDITYRIVSGKPVIYLYGRTKDGQRIAVADRFDPYFWAIPQKKSVKERLENLSGEKDGESYSVTSVEEKKKRLLGKEVEVLKITVSQPKDVPLVRELIREWDDIQSVHEADILFTRRYLIDKKIIPMTLVVVEGEEGREESRIPVIAATAIRPAEDEETMKGLGILAVDIETYYPKGKGIDMDNNPILMFAVYGKNISRVIAWKRFATKRKSIEFVQDEAALLHRFREIVLEEQPDIITGYFSDGFDLPYIKRRAEKLKVNLDIGADFSGISLKKGMDTESKITGIAHFDVIKFVRGGLRTSIATDSYSLNAVASKLLGETKHEVELDDLAEVWDKRPEKLEPYCDYNLQDALLTYQLAEKLLPNLTELVKLIGLPLQDCNRMSFSQLVESFLLRKEGEFDEIAPEKPTEHELAKRRKVRLQGAFVHEPTPGLYHDLAVYDFRSLYPSIIASHNISPDTVREADTLEEGAFVVREEKVAYSTAKKGFIAAVVEEVITRRMRVKDILKKKKDPFLEARAMMLKILANSFYGYLGFPSARWYSFACAASVTALGRRYITETIEKAEKAGFKVLYSDTDSIFLSLQGKSKAAAKKFVDDINEHLPGLMELEYEGFYPSGIFVSAKDNKGGAKKRYALLREDGSLVIKGFEAVRRNTSVIAKEVQEHVLKAILEKADDKKALNYLHGVIKGIREKKLAVEKMVIRTRLTKPISSYDAIGPHVAIAKQMKGKGIDIAPGAIIRYVVTTGGGRIRDRAKLPEATKQSEYDADYYINNQIIPAVEKIFEVFGHTKEELLGKGAQMRLLEF